MLSLYHRIIRNAISFDSMLVCVCVSKKKVQEVHECAYMKNESAALSSSCPSAVIGGHQGLICIRGECPKRTLG